MEDRLCDRETWLRAYGLEFRIWEFPKITGTLFWGPYNKDPTI